MITNHKAPITSSISSVEVDYPNEQNKPEQKVLNGSVHSPKNHSFKALYGAHQQVCWSTIVINSLTVEFMKIFTTELG